ncbi:glycosyltransferase family 4 protein [Rhodonellum sp.]|uniref:glycosyltransferase family 4 protein n=1 Tax=Rhodonellum sp. TaxID=2231180 RepID=UPI00271FAE26|nr:glycosyltransferase family 4 protein [Rhodonellum sp.]MDO9554491.1 glycosyltransferase family 4 protein [Rhodonellum sp.]
MKILFVSRPKEAKVNPFVREQALALELNPQVLVDHYLIQKGGVFGYYHASKEIAAIWDSGEYDIIHVHNGLSSFAVIFAKIFSKKRINVVITFHGTDINKISERIFSITASKFSAHNILVSSKMEKYVKTNYSIIPCGIDTDVELGFREITREKFGWSKEDFVVLFSSGFDKKVKDPEFAFAVIEKLSKSSSSNVKFIELKGYDRQEANHLMQAADVMLMCSKSEGSPQVIKESIINRLPVVSNDVGEVEEICSGVDHCFVIEKDIDKYVNVLSEISKSSARITNPESVLKKFDNRLIVDDIFKIYKNVLN